MSLVVDDQRFEALRGTMLTDEGFDGVLQFATKLPDYAVIEGAFTDFAADILPRSTSGQENNILDCTVPEIDLLQNFFKAACWTGYNGRFGIAGQYERRADKLGWHVDVKSSHTALGYFNVSGSPTIEIQTQSSERDEIWQTSIGVRYLVKIAHDADPVVIPVKHKQLVLINGRATEATTPRRPGEIFVSSLPHQAVVEGSDRRDRLMFYAEPVWFDY